MQGLGVFQVQLAQTRLVEAGLLDQLVGGLVREGGQLPVQSAQQRAATLPLLRPLQLMVPTATAVVLKLGRIGPGALRMLDRPLLTGRILAHLIGTVMQTQTPGIPVRTCWPTASSLPCSR